MIGSIDEVKKKTNDDSNQDNHLDAKKETNDADKNNVKDAAKEKEAVK
jgi:Sec-independent protein translocase protein TatA